MRKILLLIPAFICPVLILSQTISPLYIDNDSIDVSNMQFINPANGSKLKSKTEGQLVHINDILPELIKMIIPFKNGNQIILDSVQTKYFYDRCVIRARYNPQDSSKFKQCASIVYYLGCRVFFGKMVCYPGNFNMQFDFSPHNVYYDELTKDLKIDKKKRWRLFVRNLKKRFPGYQYDLRNI